MIEFFERVFADALLPGSNASVEFSTGSSSCSHSTTLCNDMILILDDTQPGVMTVSLVAAAVDAGKQVSAQAFKGVPRGSVCFVIRESNILLADHTQQFEQFLRALNGCATTLIKKFADQFLLKLGGDLPGTGVANSWYRGHVCRFAELKAAQRSRTQQSAAERSTAQQFDMSTHVVTTVQAGCQQLPF